MVALSGSGVCHVAHAATVVTLEQLFESAEKNSVQLRPSLSAEDEALKETAVARSGRLPDINLSLITSPSPRD